MSVINQTSKQNLQCLAGYYTSVLKFGMEVRNEQKMILALGPVYIVPVYDNTNFKNEVPFNLCAINTHTQTVNTTKFFVFIIATCFDPRGSFSG
jgi:hypothetical protein